MDPCVLIVDDEVDVLQMLAGEFEREGFLVLRATRPEEALSLPVNIPVDLVVTDIMLQGTSGIEVAQSLNGLIPDVPIIATSASERFTDEARACGVFRAVYQKPFGSVRMLIEQGVALAKAHAAMRTAKEGA